VATFGKTTDGASISGSSANRVWVSAGTPAETGTVQTGHVRLLVQAGLPAAFNTRFVIYADSAGSPGALLAQSDVLSIPTSATTESERVYTFSGGQQITVNSGTQYWIGLAWDDPDPGGTLQIQISRDNTATSRYEQTATAGPTPPNPYGSPTANNTGPIDAYVTFSTGPTVVGGSDSATGSSGTASTTATLTPSADTATGAESGALTLPGSDSGTGAETGFVAEEKLGGDTGAGAETYDSSATVTSGEAAGGQELGNTSAALDPPTTETGAGAEEGHIAIPGADSAAGTDAHAPPTLVTVTTGDGGTGAEGGYVETLFGDLIISLKAIDPDTGELVELPDYEALDFSRERNSKGAIRFQYPIDGKSFDLLRSTITADRDLEFELWTNGTQVGAMRGLLQEASGDDVVADDDGEDGSWQFAGSFLEVYADEAVVFPQDRGTLITDPDTGKQTWSNAKRELIVYADTPGELMLLLLDQAQDRGALVDVVADFTTTHDSNGVAWEGVLTAKFSPGSTYAQILDRLVKLHLVEWALVWDSTLQQKTFKLWNPEGRGADLTVGPRPVVLRRGRNLLDAPRKWSVRDSVTTLLAGGAEGLYDDETDPTALARRDRRIESYVSLNNITDEEALLGFAQAELATVTPGLQSVEHGIGMLPGEPRPIVAFDIGDWVYSQSGVEPERLRVVQWTLSVDINRSLSGTVSLNTTVQDEIERLREQLDAISSGEVATGASEPGADTEDLTPPAAPEGVVASSIAYQDPVQGLGQTLAFVTVGWQPVTVNADGSDSPLVQCAVFVKDKLEDEIANPPGPDDPTLDPATWLWEDCPRIVQDFAAPLRALWVAAGSPADRIAWLTAYIAEESQTPTAADDVAGYRVRYAYLGLSQVGGLPSSDPFPDDERFYYEATPPEGTSSNSYSFGGVEGGSRLRIEVCAFDRTGNQGPWTTIAHDSSNDATPPPVPSTPTIKTWFRTLDVTWDGLGSEGEVMPFDFFAVRVWIGQGADMTLPTTEPQYATPFDPLETGPQFVGTLSASGTWNVPDLPYGVGYYAVLQSIDYAGNPSTRSAVAGPVTAEQLFSDDLRDFIINHPDMIDSSVIRTAHIANAQIINALIADATIQAAKIGTVSAGSIVTGTMTATITVSGSLWTSLDSNATRLGFSAAGLQLFKTNSPSAGSTLVGEWKTSDGSMLVTGTYRSAVSGERVHIDPDGSFRLYPTSGTNYSQISNVAGEAIWRGPLDGSQRSGRVNVNTLGVGLNFSAEANLLENIRAEFLVLDRQTRMTAPFQNFQVDNRFTSPVGGNRRIQFSWLDSDGDFVSNSGLSYGISSSGSWGGFYGNDTGWALKAIGPEGSGDDGRFVVTTGSLANYGVGLATFWEVPSSADVKEDIEDARAVLDPMETVRNARARKYRYQWRPQNDTPNIGIIAEELPEVLQRKVIEDDGTETTTVDIGSLAGVVWGTLNQILDQEIVSTSAIAVLDASGFFPPNIFPADATVEVPVTWESTPPAAPTGGFVQVHSSFVWASRVTAWIKTGSTTETGCTVVFKNISGSAFPTSPSNDNTRVSATAIGLGLYTPPYVPPEEP